MKRGTSPRPPEGGLGYSHLVRTLGSTFSITYSYQAFRTLSVLNRLQTYRLLLCVRVFPPRVFHDEHPLVPNVYNSGPTHLEVSFKADFYYFFNFEISVDICCLTKKLDHFMPMVFIVNLIFYSCQGRKTCETDSPLKSRKKNNRNNMFLYTCVENNQKCLMRIQSVRSFPKITSVVSISSIINM